MSDAQIISAKTIRRLKTTIRNLRVIPYHRMEAVQISGIAFAIADLENLIREAELAGAPTVIIELKDRGVEVVRKYPEDIIVHIHDLDYELDQGDLCDICQTAPHLEGDCLCGGCRAELELGKPGSDDDEISF